MILEMPGTKAMGFCLVCYISLLHVACVVCVNYDGYNLSIGALIDEGFTHSN